MGVIGDGGRWRRRRMRTAKFRVLLVWCHQMRRRQEAMEAIPEQQWHAAYGGVPGDGGFAAVDRKRLWRRNRQCKQFGAWRRWRNYGFDSEPGNGGDGGGASATANGSSSGSGFSKHGCATAIGGAGGACFGVGFTAGTGLR